MGDEETSARGEKRRSPSIIDQEDIDAKRRRILQETRDIDADDESLDEDDDSSDDDSDDEDAELQRELERVRREREEKKKREVRICFSSSGLRFFLLTLYTGRREDESRTRHPRTRYCIRKSAT